MSKAQAAATSNRKSSFSAAALVTTKDTLTFRLHPKQLVALRSKATEILYRGAAGGGKPHLMRAAASSMRQQRPRRIWWRADGARAVAVGPSKVPSDDVSDGRRALDAP